MKSSLIMRYVSCVLGGSARGWQAGVLAVAASLDAEPRLELRSLVREALENNPDIRAAQQRWEAAKAVIPQVKTLPDPLINLGYDQVEERGVTYGFSQEIPFPGKLRLRGEVATREAERVEQEYLAVPLRIIARPKEAFYDLAFVHRSIETVEKNRRVLLDFAQTAEARYAVGRGVQQDIFRAQTEVSHSAGASGHPGTTQGLPASRDQPALEPATSRSPGHTAAYPDAALAASPGGFHCPH